MAAYDEFRFKPAPWLPHSDLPLEELERVRGIKREDMEYTNEHGFSVKVVMDPTLHMVQDMFYRILMSDLEDKPFTPVDISEFFNCSTTELHKQVYLHPLPEGKARNLVGEGQPFSAWSMAPRSRRGQIALYSSASASPRPPACAALHSLCLSHFVSIYLSFLPSLVFLPYAGTRGISAQAVTSLGTRPQ